MCVLINSVLFDYFCLINWERFGRGFLDVYFQFHDSAYLQYPPCMVSGPK